MKRLFFLTLSIFFSAFIIFLFPIVKFLRPFLPFSNYLLGNGKPTSYLILLGNDTELRANGGFAGSYAKIFLNFPKYKIDFQDIYVPNGQLAGHVSPPAPIQQAFGHGTWELANADWEPDFPTSARDIRWFLEKGQEINPDILSIINLSTIKEILNHVGTFSVPEYSAEITPDNLYLFLQGKSELNFFPGSTQKKDVLTAVGGALVKKIKLLPIRQKIRIAKILFRELSNQNIVLNSLNQDFQNLLEQKNFAGALSPKSFDTFSLNEVNLGANKANQFVKRHTGHQITYSGQKIHHIITIDFTNSSPEANPNPPIHYGGNYLPYLRLYIPAIAQNISLTGSPVAAPLISKDLVSPTIFRTTDNPKIIQKYGFTEIGFWHNTSAGGTSNIKLEYDLPLSNRQDYSLSILKQYGLSESPQTIKLFEKEYSTLLRSNFSL